MKIRKRGKLVFGLDLRAPTVDVIVLLGYDNYRVRADIGRLELRDGWQVRLSKIRAWKILPYGIFTTHTTYFEKEFIH